MSDRPDITVREDTARKRFEAVVDGEVAGFIAYQSDGDTVDLQHTEVDDRWEGKGIGGALASGTLDQVRGSGRKVVPTCSFVRGYIDRHEEYADLLA